MASFRLGTMMSGLYIYFHYKDAKEIDENDRVQTYCIFILMCILASFSFCFIKKKDEKDEKVHQISAVYTFKRFLMLLKSKTIYLILIPSFYTGKLV